MTTKRESDKVWGHSSPECKKCGGKLESTIIAGERGWTCPEGHGTFTDVDLTGHLLDEINMLKVEVARLQSDREEEVSHQVLHP